MASASTPRGSATRERILVAAADLMARRGIAATTLDDVRAATSTSKSQLYHYFDGKAGLVRAVVAWHVADVMAHQALEEDPVSSLEALQRWRYRTLSGFRAQGFTRPCPLGRLAAEVDDDDARADLDAAFTRWRTLLAEGLGAMIDDGRLEPTADPVVLATGLLVAVQGGSLLAATARAAQPLRDCLDSAVAQVEARAVTGPSGPRTPDGEAATALAR